MMLGQLQFMTSSLCLPGVAVSAASENPLEKLLTVPCAATTLPDEAAKTL